MNTAKCLVIAGILALLALIARAEPVISVAPEAEATYYRAGEFGLSLGTDVTSADLENGRLGYAGAVRYYLTQNWGIGLAAGSSRLDDDYRVAPLLLFRLPYGRAALLTEAGAEYDISNEDWSLRLAVGPAYRFTKNIEASLTVGARKFFGSGRQDQSIESVTTAQVTFWFGGK